VRLAGWIVGLPLALLLVVFAVANRHEIRLELWPLPFAVDLPAYLAVFGAALIGLVIGAAATWLAGSRGRSRARGDRRRAAGLERQLDAHKGPSPSP
jgi:uncharacterized integral membrane protein